MSEDKKKASSAKAGKSAEEKKKEEVLENIMEELEEEAKEKEAAETSATKEDKDDAEANPTVEKEDKKKEKKNPLQEKIDELNDKVLRQMAEFENFRKRTDKEKSQQFELGQGNVLEKLLPVVDNFERGLAAVPEAEKDGAFADGMNKIYKQLIKQLEDLGVTPIEAVGKEFDPNLHNAVMQVESQEYESGIVAQELQKGYMFHDTVLRHSMVAVAQ
ncbi:nucleotide exchange factor GrpE [Butyrivibrio sp. XPD2006]|uniref:nucleotide exchange factor GrpE n=1 Tax=Butyrivibrio sp. XPD2006 TaxID=1280668 RepID=UPI0003B4FB00|nr:nucleotide exchange factor GrpE [Butyrivibrio sp. XPD2006]